MPTREQTLTSIDSELKKRAQQKRINFSETLELALSKKLGDIAKLPENEGSMCEFCGTLGEKATRENLTGLTWLCPDEKWICESCLREKSLVPEGMPKTEHREIILQLCRDMIAYPPIRDDILKQVKKQITG